MKAATNPTIREFEEHLCRTGTECAVVLGLAYSTYQQYRTNRAEPTRSTIFHIDVIQRLPLDRLHELVKERLRNGG